MWLNSPIPWSGWQYGRGAGSWCLPHWQLICDLQHVDDHNALLDFLLWCDLKRGTRVLLLMSCILKNETEWAMYMFFFIYVQIWLNTCISDTNFLAPIIPWCYVLQLFFFANKEPDFPIPLICGELFSSIAIEIFLSLIWLL